MHNGSDQKVVEGLSEEEQDREFVREEANEQVTQPVCRIPLFTRTRDAWEIVVRGTWCVHPPCIQLRQRQGGPGSTCLSVWVS
jgi:hypothetical protein